MVEPTSVEGREERHESIDDLFDCLASGERRRILRLVSNRDPEPVPRDELAIAIAAWTNGKSRDEVSPEARQEVAASLLHVHLPRLTAAGLVTCDTNNETVALANHSALRNTDIRNAIADDVPASVESFDALFEALADVRRRTALNVLSHQYGPIHVETLARELLADDRGTTESEVPESDVERVLKRLYHVDLPRLAAAELVDYDPEVGTVAYEGHPQLRVPWMHSVLEPEFRQSLTGESDPHGIGEIEGREQVISFGQSLCDRADDELFAMFTDTDLLEAGCLTRIRDASRRGTDVYLGTRDPDIRDYVRENAPDVVLWEPNTDWLNLPVAGDRVGRLLLADREAVMLGTLLEETTDGVHDEEAIVGEGEHNTLVTMICQLLGPRLEEIDADTEDIEARLPV